jgi:hypothetical protein
VIFNSPPRSQRGEAASKGTDSNQQSNCHKKHSTRFGEWPDKNAFSHTILSRALISAANRFPAKYDFAGKETAAPIGALLMTENTQRPFCVFCGNWIVWFERVNVSPAPTAGCYYARSYPFTTSSH